eukprot:363516-Chlamydomonas_euryale.AAC.8
MLQRLVGPVDVARQERALVPLLCCKHACALHQLSHKHLANARQTDEHLFVDGHVPKQRGEQLRVVRQSSGESADADNLTQTCPTEPLPPPLGSHMGCPTGSLLQLSSVRFREISQQGKAGSPRWPLCLTDSRKSQQEDRPRSACSSHAQHSRNNTAPGRITACGCPVCGALWRAPF